MEIEELIDEKINKYHKVIKLNNEAISFTYSRAFLGENRTALKVIEDLQQLKASLPTQPELVEVPPCADVFLNNGNKELNLAYLISCKRNFLSCEMREGELKQWLRNTSLHDLLSLVNGYTVLKEQLYWAVMGVTDYFKCDGKIIVFTKEEEAVEVANLIGINTRAEQLESHEHSDCVLIDELRTTI